MNRPPTSGEERPRSVVLKDKYTKELIYRHSIHRASSLTADCFDGAAVQDDIKGTEATQGIMKRFPTFVQVTSTNVRQREDKCGISIEERADELQRRVQSKAIVNAMARDGLQLSKVDSADLSPTTTDESCSSSSSDESSPAPRPEALLHLFAAVETGAVGSAEDSPLSIFRPFSPSRSKRSLSELSPDAPPFKALRRPAAAYPQNYRRTATGVQETHCQQMELEEKASELAVGKAAASREGEGAAPHFFFPIAAPTTLAPTTLAPGKLQDEAKEEQSSLHCGRDSAECSMRSNSNSNSSSRALSSLTCDSPCWGGREREDSVGLDGLLMFALDL